MEGFITNYKKYVCYLKKSGPYRAIDIRNVAVESFISNVKDYDEVIKYMAIEMKRVALDLDFDKIWFITSLWIELENRNQILDREIGNRIIDVENKELIKYCLEFVNNFIDYFEYAGTHDIHGFIEFEYLIDFLVTYKNESMIPTVERICSMTIPLEYGYHIVYTCIKKSMIILWSIRNEQCLEILKKCLDHPSDEISEEAEEYFEILKRGPIQAPLPPES